MLHRLIWWARTRYLLWRDILLDRSVFYAEFSYGGRTELMRFARAHALAAKFGGRLKHRQVD